MVAATKRRKRKSLLYQKIEQRAVSEEEEQAELFTADIPEFIKEKGVDDQDVSNRKRASGSVLEEL